MRTNDDGNPDFADILESGKVEIGRYARMEAAGFGIVIDGAVEYSLRLTPSNKILGRFASTRDAWPAVLAAVERGMPPKCLILDWHWANGRRGRVSSGRLLVSTARSGLGLDVEQDRVRAWPAEGRRVGESPTAARAKPIARGPSRAGLHE